MAYPTNIVIDFNNVSTLELRSAYIVVYQTYRPEIGSIY